MVTVVIESIVVKNGKEYTSSPKLYNFQTYEAAEEFFDALRDIRQGEHSDNRINARIVENSVPVYETATPLLLHTVHYEHGENPSDGLRFLEDIDVLTVEEVEAFRTAGTHEGIVFAYDNPNSIEPVPSEPYGEGIGREAMLGVNLFEDDPNTTFHMSFNPNIATLLLEKYGDEESFEASKTRGA